jgi:hypothetical protein
VHEGNGGQGTYRSMASGRSSLNRTQGLVLGFFISAWAALVAILVAAPKVYDQALRLPGDEHGVAPLVFLAVIFTFLALLGVGRQALALDVLVGPGCVRPRWRGARASVGLGAGGGAARGNPCLVRDAPRINRRGAVRHRAGDAGRLPTGGSMGKLLRRLGTRELCE